MPKIEYRIFRFLLIPLSALLYILSFPKHNLSFLAWLTLVPLVFAVSNHLPRHAFFIGWLTGTLSYMGILYWIIVTFLAAHLSLGLALLCWVLLASYLGLFWGVWTASISLMGTVPTDKPSALLGPSRSLYAAAVWVTLEFVRTHLFSGFPWTLLGDSQWQLLSLIQIVSFTSVYGVSFLVVLVNVTLASLLGTAPTDKPSAPLGPSPFFKRHLGSLGMMSAVVLVSYLLGRHRMAAYAAEPLSPSMNVALLQGNIDQYKKWDKAYVDDIEHTFELLTQEAAPTRPDLIVWPETSVPGYLFQDPLLRDWLNRVIRRSNTFHLIGAPSMDVQEKTYNSAILFSPHAEVIGQYDKTHLVPFGEVVPWVGVLGRWIHVLNDLGGFTPGRRLPVLPTLFGGLGVNICYEAIFPDLVRRSVLHGAALIINLTNDGWYMRTAAPYQHFIPNIFRAVENDRWVLRADNTGITGIISPVGEIQAASRIFEPAVIEGFVYPRHTLTFYTRHGDVFAWGCCLLCFLLSLRAILRR